MRIGLSQEPDALAVQGAVAHTAVRKSLIPWTKDRGPLKLDEAYFGGRRKGQRGRAPAGKSVVFGLLEREGRVYTKVVESVSAEELMQHI